MLFLVSFDALSPIDEGLFNTTRLFCGQTERLCNMIDFKRDVVLIRHRYSTSANFLLCLRNT